MKITIDLTDLTVLLGALITFAEHGESSLDSPGQKAALIDTFERLIEQEPLADYGVFIPDIENLTVG